MIIYKVTNIINGKTYIGQTNRTLFKRKQEHERINKNRPGFNRAIQKYGKDNFKWEILEDDIEDQNLLDMLERLYIAKYESSVDDWGYNIREGGNGKGKIHDTTKEKLSTLKQGKQQGKYRGTYYSHKTRKPWLKVWPVNFWYNKHSTYLGTFEDPFTAELVYELVYNEVFK